MGARSPLFFQMNCGLKNSWAIKINFFMKSYLSRCFIIQFLQSAPQLSLQRMQNILLGCPIFSNHLFQQNPIITLYKVQSALEQELAKQIQLNTFLKILQIKGQEEHNIAEALTIHSSQQIKESEEKKQIPRLIQRRNRQKFKKMRNETKNISKNFGKAMISFVQNNEKLVRRALSNEGVSYENFYLSLKARKRRISSIQDLRNMWLDNQYKYAKQMRIVSQFFLRRASISYIFKSRIVNVRGHIKYRNRFIEVLKNPHEFTYVKAN